MGDCPDRAVSVVLTLLPGDGRRLPPGGPCRRSIFRPCSGVHMGHGDGRPPPCGCYQDRSAKSLGLVSRSAVATKRRAASRDAPKEAKPRPETRTRPCQEETGILSGCCVSLYFEGHFTRMYSATNTSPSILPSMTTCSASSKLAGFGLAYLTCRTSPLSSAM